MPDTADGGIQTRQMSKLQTRSFRPMKTRYPLSKPCRCAYDGYRHRMSIHIRLPAKEFPSLYEKEAPWYTKKVPLPGAVVVARMLSTPQWAGSIVELGPTSYTVAHLSGAIARINL